MRILYAAQTSVAPPTFVFFTNVATEFHFSYERFLVNRLRESFGLLGTPVTDPGQEEKLTTAAEPRDPPASDCAATSRALQ